MNRTFSSIASFLLILIALFTTASCEENKSNNFTIACLNEVEPFAFTDASGNLTGLEIELMQAIADDQDIKIKFKPMDFEDIIADQKSKKPNADGAIGLITWTAARRTYFEFSYPYLASGIALAVRTGYPVITSIEDLAGKTISTKKGTFIEEYANLLSDSLGFTVKGFENVDGAFYALANGSVDAIMEEYPLIAYRIDKGADMKVSYCSELTQMLSMIIKADAKSTLIESFNVGLQNIKENGTYNSILNKYLPGY